MRHIALVDCNSFYCSCERVFRPELRGRPVIVLSNNDGCAIAFTKEAKAIGFGEMCEPYFQVKERIRKHKVAVFSSNYTLYDSFSRRVMDVLRTFTPDLETYSVDEAFLGFEGFERWDLKEYGHKIRSEVLRLTGIPVGVGISRTKVLSKIANKLAKRSSGVWVMSSEEEIDRALKDFPVRDIWGVGHRSAAKLNVIGVRTALDFKRFPNTDLIQRLLTKTGREVQDELRGINCLSIEEADDKKNTGTSRSFGTTVRTKRELQEALADFCTQAAIKLRKQDGVCFSLTAFIHTNPFKEGTPQYYGQGGHTFLTGTSDTIRLIKASHQVLDEIYRPGYEYKKGGVLLNHIVPRSENQMALFGPTDDNERLSSVVDEINRRYGPHTIMSAACGTNQSWRVIADHKSRLYTTSWDDLLKVKVV